MKLLFKTKTSIILLCATSIIGTLNGCATIDKWMGKDADKKESASVVAEPEPVRKGDIQNTQFSGYLVNYKDMKETHTATGGTSLRWVSPDLEKGKYTAIIIDPVGFYPKPPLLAKVSKGKMLSAVQYLAEQAKKEIGRELKIVDKPGPGVLRWDAAITGVKGSSTSVPSTKNLPASMIFTDASPIAVPSEHGFVVYLESRLVDSQTKKVMAKSVRAGVGSKVADPKTRVTVEEIKPVLNGWVQDASAFIREYVK
jgi:hypothetical protein